MKQKVVVIGHGYTSRLGVVRALGRAGYEVIVIVMTGYKKGGELNTKKPLDCYSKFVSRCLFCHAKDGEGLIQILLDECADPQQKVVVIPDSDFSSAVIDQHQKELEAYFLFPHINHTPGAVVDWMDKDKQKSTAKAIGLPVAASHTVVIQNKKYQIPDGVSYPCFVKPLATIVGGKRLLKRCDTEEQLKAVLELAGSLSDMQVLVEDFKKIETEYALLGVSDGKEVVIPGILEILSMSHGGHFGVACQGKVMPIRGFEEVVDKFKAFVLQTEFVGIFDIDFYKSDGRFYFSEMNFRYGGSGYASTASGVNLPDLFVRMLTGVSTKGMPFKVDKVSVYVNERMCREDWMSNYISTKEFQKLLTTADISFVKDDDDPEPQRLFYNDINNPILHLKRYIKKILGRK